MADRTTVALEEDDAARMTTLRDEVKQRLGEMAAIFARAVGIDPPPEDHLTFRPVQGGDGARRLTYIELICDPNGTCGCNVYHPNGHVESEWPCGG